MEQQFMLYLASLFNDKRNTHFDHLTNIGGRIYYGRNSHTFKKNRRKELKKRNKR